MVRKLVLLPLAAALAVAVAVGPAQAWTTKGSVKVQNNRFSPKTVTIEEGGKVTWRWTEGGVRHNVTPANGNRGSKTSSRKGFKFTKTFEEAGTFRYVCTVHPGAMKMTVKVR
jgi:plastocyanin